MQMLKALQALGIAAILLAPEPLPQSHFAREVRSIKHFLVLWQLLVLNLPLTGPVLELLPCLSFHASFAISLRLIWRHAQAPHGLMLLYDGPEEQYTVLALPIISFLLACLQLASQVVADYLQRHDVPSRDAVVHWWDVPAHLLLVNDECPICLAPLQEEGVIITQCAHLFHKDCVAGWAQRSGRCPVCRQAM